MQAGQLKVPPGYHPLDVEKEWGKLHVAILEREKQLRSEFERWAGAGVDEAAGGRVGPCGGREATPRVSHCLGRKSPLPRGWETRTRGQLSCGPQAGGQAGSRRGAAPCGGEPGGLTPLTAGPVAALGRRLERLQRVVSKLQMEAGLCEEQLNQADALLQSVRGGDEGGPGRGGLGEGGGP